MVKKLPADLTILILVIALCAGVVVWKIVQQHRTVRASGNPADVVSRFIEATNRGDQREAALCLSKTSLAEARRAEGDKTEAISPTGKNLAKIILTVASNDGKIAKVIMKSADGLAHKRKSRYYIKGAFKDGVPYIVISEGGVWKLDMTATEKLWFASLPEPRR
jgi:hypothetical protein